MRKGRRPSSEASPTSLPWRLSACNRTSLCESRKVRKKVQARAQRRTSARDELEVIRCTPAHAIQRGDAVLCHVEHGERRREARERRACKRAVFVSVHLVHELVS